MVFRNVALICWYCRYTNGTPRVALILLLEAVSQLSRLKRELLGIFFRMPFKMSWEGRHRSDAGAKEANTVDKVRMV